MLILKITVRRENQGEKRDKKNQTATLGFIFRQQQKTKLQAYYTKFAEVVKIVQVLPPCTPSP